MPTTRASASLRSTAPSTRSHRNSQAPRIKSKSTSIPIRQAKRRNSNTNSKQSRPLKRRSTIHDSDNPDDEDDVYQSSSSESDPDLDLRPRPTSSDYQEDSEEEDLLNRLASQFSPEPEANTTPLDTEITELDNTNASPTHIDEPLIFPTIKEYKDLLDDWPMSRITVQSRAQKKKSTSVPPHILKEAEAIQELYKHQKSMLALMGNISTFTLDKALGEIGGHRKSGAYQKWLRYSKERRRHQMPAGGQTGTGILAKRNRDLGAIWTALPDEHVKVFEPAVFYALSGLSHSTLDGSDKEDGDLDQPYVFAPGERAHLQVLYDELVCKEKVAKDYAKVAAGIPEGPSLPDYNRKSKKCLERIHNQLHNESKNMDFAYYLLACSTHAATESTSASPGWCKEFTSHNEMAEYVNKKSNFGNVFAARVQGLSVSEVVAATIGGSNMIESEKARKADPGDKVKGDLAALLRPKFSALIGYDRGFPRGPDPEELLARKYHVKIIQMPGSQLPKDVLKLGFNRMNSRRKLWLDDVQAELFQLTKLTSTSTVSAAQNGGNNGHNDDSSDDEVTMTQAIQNTGQINDFMGVEDEEWNGFADDFEEDE